MFLLTVNYCNTLKINMKNIYVVQKSIESREFQNKIKVITRCNQLVCSLRQYSTAAEKKHETMQTYVIKGKHFFLNATINKCYSDIWTKGGQGLTHKNSSTQSTKNNTNSTRVPAK